MGIVDKIFIIAEAGVNHNGSIDRAVKMVETAAKAGADAVKFQTFRADTLVTENAEKAGYQIKGTGSQETQYEMLEQLALSLDDHLTLMEECQRNRIEFLSTPFDLASIDMLKELGMKRWKIPSGEITNLPFLRKIASLDQDIILSTGMSSLDEIKDALDILTEKKISLGAITVLHCNTEYPTPMEDVNLRAMETIKKSFPGVNTGYSDHTLGMEAAIAAAAMGASIIEKHFTLSNSLKGPDHASSLEPGELAAMVSAIRNIEKALGTGRKEPTRSEMKNIPIVRKSIIASKRIVQGEKFTINNLTVKRPGTGMSPMKWDTIIGKTAEQSYAKDELI